MNILLFEPLYLGGHKNTNDSNFVLYRNPNLSLNSFNQLKRYMDKSFSFMTIIPGEHKDFNDSTECIILLRGLDSSHVVKLNLSIECYSVEKIH